MEPGTFPVRLLREQRCEAKVPTAGRGRPHGVSIRPLRICVFAAAPPPMHGSSYAVQLLVRSPLALKHRVTHINTAYAGSLANTGVPETRKLGLMLRYLWLLVRAERREHFAYIVVAPAFTLWPCVRDMLSILAASVGTRARIVAW